MKKLAIFVDAGYFFSGSAFSLFKEHKKRNEISLDISKLYNYLKDYSAEHISSPLLRIYWYDGSLPTGLSVEQQKVAQTPGILFRKGFINEKNEQKGIDTHIVAELLELSYKNIIDEAIIIGADSDLTVGVEYAQNMGIKVTLMTVSNIGISQDLRNQADSVCSFNEEVLSNIITLKNINDLQKEESQLYNCVVEEYISLLTEDIKSELVKYLLLYNNLPHERDKELLKIAAIKLSRPLKTEEKHMLRDTLIKKLKS